MSADGKIVLLANDAIYSCPALDCSSANLAAIVAEEPRVHLSRLTAFGAEVDDDDDVRVEAWRVVRLVPDAWRRRGADHAAAGARDMLLRQYLSCDTCYGSSAPPTQTTERCPPSALARKLA